MRSSGEYSLQEYRAYRQQPQFGSLPHSYLLILILSVIPDEGGGPLGVRPAKKRRKPYYMSGEERILKVWEENKIETVKIRLVDNKIEK